MSVEEDGLRLEEHRLFPQLLQRLPLLRDASLELGRDVVSDFYLRLRNRQEMGQRLIERRELPSFDLAVLPQFNRRRVDRSAFLEDDGRPRFLVDRDCDVVQRRVQRIDLPVLEVLDSSLLVDARAQTQFLCVGASEIQYSREDPDHLALGALQSLREAVAVQVERVDARDRIRIPFADLAAVGDIDPKYDLVVPLINLVDVATEETLPFRDEDTEVERGDGGFHCARCCEDPCVT